MAAPCAKDRRSRVRRTWGSEGVASTVGTIMALMIFLTLLSVFTNQYVPVWMEDNEAKHMAFVEMQFGQLKWGMDNQILAAQFGGTHEIMVYTPITLGSEGVPMFASPTAGILNINPGKGNCSVVLGYNITGGSITDYTIYSNTTGTIEMYAPNRYYVQQRMIYENDALLLVQPDGMLVKSMPQFVVRKEGDMYRVSLTQVGLIGVNKSYAGTGTTGIHTALRYAATEYLEISERLNLTTNATIVIGSEQAQAWHTYISNYLNRSGVSPSAYVLSPVAANSFVLEFDRAALLSFSITTAHFELFVGEEGS
ncbi:MAG: hypothetical protein AB1665_04515 [Candidatus Thermoplasmatota archaeon]